MPTITGQCFLLLLTAAWSTGLGVFGKFAAKVRNMHSKPLESRIGGVVRARALLDSCPAPDVR